MSDKISLRNADIIMAYRGATPARAENLHTIIRHFDMTYCDYRILLMEADAAPTFDWRTLADPKVQHTFIANDGPFPKALLYNTGAKLASSPVLIFNDVDCIAEPNMLALCVFELLTYQAHDVLAPFMPMIDIAGELKQKFVANPSYAHLQGIDKDALIDGSTLLYERNAGGVFVFKRADFVRIGGLDGRFVGWGGEDNELLWRAQRLGLRWSSTPQPLFHLHHESANRPEWSGTTNEGLNNGKMAEDVQTMPLDELNALVDELRQFFA
ncbi:MAG: galactosyltransferase-related protein [Formosimonas sp.]